ncbi:hypothetical protein V6N13_137950 [Hibiscus sabdariffa]|uniref:Uncharacterized protein n=1 Tax=Hibiscus sabdariffa TaxID=183260 RepID=A0ABR2QC48_9ROSI
MSASSLGQPVDNDGIDLRGACGDGTGEGVSLSSPSSPSNLPISLSLHGDANEGGSELRASSPCRQLVKLGETAVLTCMRPGAFSSPTVGAREHCGLRLVWDQGISRVILEVDRVDVFRSLQDIGRSIAVADCLTKLVDLADVGIMFLVELPHSITQALQTDAMNDTLHAS